MALSYDIVKPGDLSHSEWQDLHVVYHSSYYEELKDKRSEDEINHLTRWNDFDRFHASHLDPNVEVGRSFNDGQVYKKPLVAVAKDGNDLMAFGYSANNVSGNAVQRAYKLRGTAHNYHWLREFVVHPEYWRQGVATHMGGMLLGARNPKQPLATYIYPDEMPFLQPLLLRRNFRVTGGKRVKIYGEDSEEVRRLRLQAPSAEAVLGS